MSADHDAADAPAPDADPHDIIPEGFVAEWNAAVERDVTTVREALRVAEEAPSTTDREDMPRCPECFSTKIHWKPGTRKYDHKREEDRKCSASSCGAHFDHPLPAPADAHRDAAHAPDTGHEPALPRCPTCESTRLYPVPERAAALDARWLCRRCGATFDDAAPSQIEALIAAAERARQREAPGVPDDHDQATLGEVTDS